jgi:hypothetical protein
VLTDLKVKVGPQVYRYHEGAIDSVPEVLKEYKDCCSYMERFHGKKRNQNYPF